MRWYSQTFSYDDPWGTVTLAYFLRYPNPYASHVVSCDVISRKITPLGTLRTSRLILKRGVLPKWAPRGIMSRAESWVIEDSEVDPHGKVVKCITKNLDHVKVLEVIESVSLTEAADGRTVQRSEAQVISRFGWGLARRIESLGVTRFKNHLEKSRDGVSLIIKLIRESRLRSFTMSPSGTVYNPSSSHPISNFPGSSGETRSGDFENKVCVSHEETTAPSSKQEERGWFQWC